jgi:hypothetical protein
MPPETPYRGGPPPTPPHPPAGLGALWGQIALAAVLVLARGLWALGLRDGQALRVLSYAVPVLGLGAAAWLGVWAVPRWVILTLRRRGAAARAHGRRAALVAGFLVAAAATERAAQRDLDARMARVVEAVERYRSDRGHFPVHLADVTPAYLDAVPTPWRLNHGCGFAYVRTGERVALRRNDLDDDGAWPCSSRHGVRYRFLTHRWDVW